MEKGRKENQASATAVGRLWRKLFPPSGYRGWVLTYQTVLVLMIGEMLFFMHGLWGRSYGGDAISYVLAMEPLSHGQPDLYRPPVFPLWLLVLRSVFGAEHLSVVTQAGNILFQIVGAWYFMRLSEKFTFGRPRATFWLTAVYCLVPQLNLYVAYTQTETLALMETVIFMWWTVRELPGHPTMRSAVMSGVWLLLLVMTRPVLICFVGVAVAYWLAIFLRTRARAALTGVAGAIFIAAVLGGYMVAFKNTYGMYYITAVTQWNNFWTLGQAGMLDPENTDNPYLKEFINDINREARVVQENPRIMSVFGSPDISEETPIEDIDALLTTTIASDRGRLMTFIWDRFRTQMLDMPLLATSRDSKYGLMEDIVRPRIWVYLVLLIITGAGLAALWRRGVRPPGSWLCWGMCIALGAVSAAGAQSDWARLLMPGVPAFMMLTYQLISFFRPDERVD